jgi:hypothetical protein
MDDPPEISYRPKPLLDEDNTGFLKHGPIWPSRDQTYGPATFHCIHMPRITPKQAEGSFMAKLYTLFGTLTTARQNAIRKVSACWADQHIAMALCRYLTQTAIAALCLRSLHRGQKIS